jgi:two-component system, NarL family, sensor kinase
MEDMDDAATTSGTRWPVARPVAGFALAGLVAVAIVGIATAAASRRVGQREAISNARSTTLVKAQTVVEPVVTDGLLTGQRRSVAAVDRVVHTGVLDRQLIRVKIWTRDGSIVYSDQPALEGTSYHLGADEIAAIDRGVIEAEISDLAKPENRFERQFGKLLEVYLPIRTPGGSRLLFEAYFRYDDVAASGSRIWHSFAPVAIGGLLALELVQIPLAYSLARRLRERQRERERLLQRALEASDTERRRIAGDLHDGVVQDLAGVAYSLAGSSRTANVAAATASLLDRSAEQVRDSIKSLRSLLVDIYPPKLEDAGLASALTDLLAGAQIRGVATHLDTDALPQPLPQHVSRVLWRAAQEAVRNVLAHAHATTVTVSAGGHDGMATLDVVDDGQGFEPSVLPEREDAGHIGLRGLTDLVADAGGQLRVESSTGAGTHVHVEVPIR